MLSKLKSLVLINLLFSSLGVLWAQPRPFLGAHARGMVGETGNLYLIDEGIFVRPFYNDVYGGTDKQLTGSFQLGYQKMWRDSALESRFHWTAITPTFREKHGQDSLVSPVGRYADWLEIQESWSKLFDLQGEQLRFQITLGIGHIGDHGIKNFHRDLHKLIGSSLEGLDYTNQPKGLTFGGGFEVGLIEDTRALWGVQRDSMLTVGYSQNKFMWDLFFSQNYIFKWSRKLLSSFEIRMVRQVESQIYNRDERLAWRSEISFGLRVSWWRPSIKYISPYIRDDQVGQTFLDPLGMYIQF